MSTGFGRLLIQVAEEILQRPVDLHVHVDGDVDGFHLDGGGLDVEAAGREGGDAGQQHEQQGHAADAGASFRDGNPAVNARLPRTALGGACQTAPASRGARAR